MQAQGLPAGWSRRIAHILLTGACMLGRIKWQGALLIHFFGQREAGQGGGEAAEEAPCPLLCAFSALLTPSGQEESGEGVPTSFSVGRSTLTPMHTVPITQCPHHTLSSLHTIRTTILRMGQELPPCHPRTWR